MFQSSPMVLPRWEWRAFAASLPELRQRLAGVTVETVREIQETYLLCLKSNHNAKIRNGVMDLKWRKQVDNQGLELWDPILKSGFPCEAKEIVQLFGAWTLPMPTLYRRAYTLEQFLQEVIDPHEELKSLDVCKVREGFTFEGTTCEFAQITAAGDTFESFCVKHEDPQLVMNVLGRLGLDGRQNINYPQALKRALKQRAA